MLSSKHLLTHLVAHKKKQQFDYTHVTSSLVQMPLRQKKKSPESLTDNWMSSSAFINFKITSSNSLTDFHQSSQAKSVFIILWMGKWKR